MKGLTLSQSNIKLYSGSIQEQFLITRQFGQSSDNNDTFSVFQVQSIFMVTQICVEKNKNG